MPLTGFNCNLCLQILYDQEHIRGKGGTEMSINVNSPGAVSSGYSAMTLEGSSLSPAGGADGCRDLFAGSVAYDPGQAGYTRMYDPEKGCDVLRPGNYVRMYDPEKGRDVLRPNHYARMYDPEKGHDALKPNYYARMYDPEQGHDVLKPNYYARMYDPEQGHDVLKPGNYTRMYDPEKGHDVLRPDNYARMYDPEKGHDVLRPGSKAKYAYVEDEFGNEMRINPGFMPV